jgi:Xaa-Pro aminopeptidase
MVVTVEPGIYIKGRFGIRIDDDVLVTQAGRQVLTHLEKDPEAMVL